MVDPITAIGLVASVVQLVQVLGGLTGSLRRSRHHGEQLVRLRGLLEEIGQLRLRIADDSLEIQQVKMLLQRCRLLLEQHDPNMNSSIGLTFKWTSDLDNEIRIINDDLTRMYTRLQVYRVDLPPTPSSSGSQHAAASVLPPVYLPEPAISRTLCVPPRHIKLNLRKLCIKTNTFDEAVISRRGSLQFIDLPAILSLGEYDARIPLQRLNILERDSWSRILQYESDDQEVIVTHRIPFGTKPTTDDNIRAKTVHFLAQHEITVEDKDGFRIYCLDPTYTFNSATNCKSFIEKVRERDLVHTCLPKDICQGGQIRARFKVLRIWRKNEGSPHRPLLTMSFLDRNVGRQVEIDLRLYGRDAARARDKRVIDIWRKDGTSKLSLSFEGSRDAIGFLETYQEIHPDPTGTPTLPPLSF